MPRTGRAGDGGAVYTFTIVHGPTLPVFQAQAPYNVAVIVPEIRGSATKGEGLGPQATGFG